MIALFPQSPSLAALDQHIDVLDRAEPQQPQTHWRASFDVLSAALWRARRFRRYCLIPIAIATALLVVLTHGPTWEWRDIQSLFGVEAIFLFATHFSLSEFVPTLKREGRITALLRYFGARNLADEEGWFDAT